MVRKKAATMSNCAWLVLRVWSSPSGKAPFPFPSLHNQHLMYFSPALFFCRIWVSDVLAVIILDKPWVDNILEMIVFFFDSYPAVTSMWYVSSNVDGHLTLMASPICKHYTTSVRKFSCKATNQNSTTRPYHLARNHLVREAPPRLSEETSGHARRFCSTRRIFRWPAVLPCCACDPGTAWNEMNDGITWRSRSLLSCL
jgi:hypothetical protein